MGEAKRKALARQKETVADQLPIKDVFNAGQIEPPFVSGNVGDISHPNFIGCGHRKLPVEHIRYYWQFMSRVCRGNEFTFLLAAQSQLSADSLDAMNAHLNPVISQVSL